MDEKEQALADFLMKHNQQMQAIKIMGFCPTCLKQHSKEGEKAFKDELSIKEWKISGLCQECQDKFFNEDDDELERLPYQDHVCPKCGSSDIDSTPVLNVGLEHTGCYRWCNNCDWDNIEESIDLRELNAEE